MASRIRWLEAKSAGNVDGGMVNRANGAKSAERSSKMNDHTICRRKKRLSKEAAMIRRTAERYRKECKKWLAVSLAAIDVYERSALARLKHKGGL